MKHTDTALHALYHAPFPLVVLDDAARIRIINARAAQLLGTAAADTLDSLIAPPYRTTFAFSLAEASARSDHSSHNSPVIVRIVFTTSLEADVSISAWQPPDHQNSCRPHYTIGITPLAAPNVPGAHSREYVATAITDTVDFALFAVAPDGRALFMNDACRAILTKHIVLTDDDKMSAERIDTDVRLFDGNFTRQIPAEHSPLFRAASDGEVVKDDLMGVEVKKTGERRILEISSMPIRDRAQEGQVLGAVARFRDVTDRELVKSREIMAKGEEYFKLVCDSIPQMIWTTDINGQWDYCNRNWRHFTGVGAEALDSWIAFVHPEDVPDVRAAWTHSLRTGEQYNAQYRCRRYDGEWLWVLGGALPLRDPAGRITKWFGSCTEIHDTVEALYAAKRSQAHLSSVINHAAITLWAVDRDGVLTVAEGPGAEQLKLINASPCPPEEPDIKTSPSLIMPLNHGELYEPSPRPRSLSGQSLGGGRRGSPISRKSLYDIWKPEVKNHIQRALRGEEVVEEMEMDGRWFRTSYTPIRERAMVLSSVSSTYSHVEREDAFSGVVGASMDITYQKRAERMMQESVQEKVRAQSAETAAKEASRLKSEFLANMSHEIRTPIAGVIGMSELLCGTELQTEQRDYAENIQRSADALLQVINDILDFSKVEIGKLEIETAPFRLNLVIRDTINMLGFAVRKKGLHFFEDVMLEHAECVMGDSGRVRQVITNLLTNAIKFTSEGSITLRAFQEDEDEDMVKVRVEVEDTGCGIPQSLMGKLFRPFSQADSSTARRFGGTGLGLTICKNLVELMNGTIGLESEEGRSSRAWFSIPFRKAKHPIAGSDNVELGRYSPYSPRDSISMLLDASLSPSTSTSSVHSRDSAMPGLRRPRGEVWVLIAEDNKMNQTITTKMLQKMGFNTDAANNGVEAVSKITQRAYDLVLMDCQMPEMDGYEATTRLRSLDQTKHIPVIAMTASAIRGDREKCIDAGMSDYLPKPVKSRVLEEMIMKWLPNVALGPPDVVRKAASLPGATKTPSVDMHNVQPRMSAPSPLRPPEPRGQNGYGAGVPPQNGYGAGVPTQNGAPSRAPAPITRVLETTVPFTESPPLLREDTLRANAAVWPGLPREETSLPGKASPIAKKVLKKKAPTLAEPPGAHVLQTSPLTSEGGAQKERRKLKRSP